MAGTHPRAGVESVGDGWEGLLMSWKDVGQWLKDNASTGAALVGSLLTGNAPGAIAAGVSLVSSATGSTDPSKALQSLQRDPATVIRLQELSNQEEASIRAHIAEMARIEFEGQQARMEDTADARKNHKGHWMPALLTLLLIVMVSGIVVLLMNHSLPDGNSEVLYLICGQIIGSFSTAIAYWLGSSRGSAEKQEYISGIKKPR